MNKTTTSQRGSDASDLARPDAPRSQGERPLDGKLHAARAERSVSVRAQRH